MSTNAQAARRKKAGRVTPKLRRGAIIAADGVLAVGTGALGGLFGTAAASATVPSPGWTGTQAPLPSSPDAPGGSTAGVVFSHESCVSAVFCAAVGQYEDSGGGGHTHGLLEVYQGGTWHGVEAPLPGNADASIGEVQIDGVSCAEQGSCVAVGSYKDSSSHAHAVIETYAGGAWTSMEAPSPSDATGTYAFLKDVSCPAPGDCFAIGSYDNASGRSGYIDALANGTWTAAPAPVPSGSTLQPSEEFISCPSTTSCAATESNFFTPEAPVVLAYAGGTWSGENAPLPTGAASNITVLSGVSCSAGACEASGYYNNGTIDQGMLERFAGGAWTVQTAPLPSNHNASPFAELYDVSCTFDGACTAVGVYTDTSDVDQPLVESIAGGAATPLEAPLPQDAATNPSSSLNAVSCLSGAACTAVGSYNNQATGTAGLIDQLSGGSWTATTAPLPSNSDSGSNESVTLEAVSCSFRGACAAAGDYFVPSTNEQGLLENYVPAEGYWTNAADGGVFTYGSATFHGSAGNLKLNQPVVGMAATPGDGGYWEVASDGGIFNYGDAPFYGSTGALKLNKPVVGMAATPDGGGYWLVAADGGIFNYGDAGFYGSTGAIKLNQPIVGMAATPDGHGYWLVAADGGIFNYGDAGFYGSRGGQPLNKPIVGMAATASGLGYWLVASDGGIFTYGDAGFFGSTGAIKLNKPIVSMMSTFDGAGYFLVASDGGIFNYGDAGFYGSAGSLVLNKPVVSGAAS